MPDQPKQPQTGDLLWIAPLVVLTFLVALAEQDSSIFGIYALAIYFVGSAALLVPLLWRSRHPIEVFVAVAVASAFQVVIGLPPVPADLAIVVAMYAVVRRCSFQWAVVAGVVTELGVIVSAMTWQLPERVLNVFPFFSSAQFSPPTTIATTVAVMLAVGTVWFAGFYGAARSRHAGEQQAHAVRERDQRAQITVANERAQIARELHDVVAHNVSVMVVHAEGGRQALDHDPELTRQALDTIWTTGKQALAEMRRIVGVLRDGDDAGAVYAPQPGIEQIPELVEQVRSSGPEVSLTTEGEPGQLPPGLQLVIYRVVQESLTNVLKHAGAGAKATVRLVYGENAIMIDIADDGAGRSRPATDPDLSAAGAVTTGASGVPGVPGHGLVGMRERVAAFGGQLDAKSHPAGGFLVHAWLPVHARTAL
ncbi:sensor histidine kinase [Flindersiella endophytica]